MQNSRLSTALPSSATTTPNKANIWALRKSTTSLPTNNATPSSTTTSSSWIKEPSSMMVIPSNIVQTSGGSKTSPGIVNTSDQLQLEALHTDQDTLSILNGLANQSSPLPLAKTTLTPSSQTSRKSGLTQSSLGGLVVNTPNKSSSGSLKGTTLKSMSVLPHNKGSDENSLLEVAPTNQLQQLAKTPSKTPSKKVSFELVNNTTNKNRKSTTPSTVLQPQNPNIIPVTIRTKAETVRKSPPEKSSIAQQQQQPISLPQQQQQGDEKFSFTVFSTLTQKNYKILIKYKDVNKLKVSKIKSNLHRVVNVPIEEQVLYASTPSPPDISISKPLEDHITGKVLSLNEKTVLILVHTSQCQQYENQTEKRSSSPPISTTDSSQTIARHSPQQIESLSQIQEPVVDDDELLQEELPRPPKTPSPNKLTSPTKDIQQARPGVTNSNHHLSTPSSPSQSIIQETKSSPSPISKQFSPKLSSPTTILEEYDLDDSFINSFINPPTISNREPFEKSKQLDLKQHNLNSSAYTLSFSNNSPPRFKMSDAEAEREKTIRNALEIHFQNQMNEEKIKLSRRYASEKKEILQKANEDRQELMTENTRLRKELQENSQRTLPGQQNRNNVPSSSDEILKLKHQLVELQASIRERDLKIGEMESSAKQLKNELVQESQIWRNKFEIEKQIAWNREKDMILRNWAEEIELLKLVQQQERIESQNIIDQIETELDVANQKIESDRKFVDSAEFALENLKNQIGKLMRGDYDTASLIMEAAKERALIEKRVSDLRSDYHSLRNLFEDEVKRRKYLHNLVEDMKGNIRVIVRMRPLIGEEQATDLSNGRIDIKDDSTITVGSQNLGVKEYDFFKVLDENVVQEDVFEHVKPMLQSAIDGYNLCIFAYGQTGSGKTFTIHGDAESGQYGLIQRTADYLFYCLEKKNLSRTESFSVSCSMVELHLDTLNDLFEQYQDAESQFKSTDKRKPPQLRQSKNGKMSVTNCIEMDVYHPNDLVKLLEFGNDAKQVSKTDMNDQSSRSHTIFTIKISMEGHTPPNSLNPQGRPYKKESKIAFVDLAGSERVSKSNSIGDRFKEAQHINKSLSALGDVIAALSTHQKHVPYRNSKLTLMLQDMIGGNSKTLMFANVSPDKKSISETMSTLSFASRVKCVKNHPMLSRQIVTDEN